MKKYTVRARVRKDKFAPANEWWEVREKALAAFPLAVEAKNKQAAEEIGRTVARDLGIVESFVFDVEIGW